MTATEIRQDYLRRHLTPLWLRPESALWYAHESHLAREMLGTPMARPSLEFTCFDGTPTLVLLGGAYGPEFDVYSEVSWSPQSHHWHSLADDYYNVSGRGGSIDVVTPPLERIDVGLTEKKAHLDKAARLNLYDHLVEHDPNRPLTMFADGSFATIWAPNLYWVDKLDVALNELRRVLAPDGRLVTVLPDISVLTPMLYSVAQKIDPGWARDIDRGRYSNFARQARTLDGWQSAFAAAGLRIARHERLIPRIVLQAHDVGFRPMFPVFMRIYDALRECHREEWRRVKQHWIDTVYYFLAPLCDTAWMDEMRMERVYHAFQLGSA
jgi:SAM-dependent methyltransferase